MTQDQYYGLSLDNIIYNVDTNKIVKVNTCFNRDKERKENDYLYQPYLGASYGGETVAAKDCEKWEFVEDSSPLEVRFEVLSYRFFELESFVYTRIR